MGFEPLIPFARGGQFRQRGLKPGLAWRGGGHLHQKSCDRIIGGDQHAISSPRRFQYEPRRKAEGVEQPRAGRDVFSQPLSNCAFFERRQKARKRAGVCGMGA